MSPTVGVIGRIGAAAVIAATAAGAGCGGTFGGPAPISDFPKKSLTITHNSADKSDAFVATLDFADISWCDTLEGDAFARLNGRSVSLFPGQVKVIPPQGDDGQVECIHPSVTLDQIPSDLSPPWTIEIGDSSETLSATFAPKSIAPVTFTDPVLAPSSGLTLTVQRQPGDTTVITGQATMTASDGQSAISTAQAGANEIVFPTFVAAWPPGPVAIAVVFDYFSSDELLGCQAPQCTVTPGSGVYGAPTTSSFTVQFTIPAD
jgi:hypothetical protein